MRVGEDEAPGTFRCCICTEQPTSNQRRRLCEIARAYGCRFVSAEGPRALEHESWFEWPSLGQESDRAGARQLALALEAAGLSCQQRGRRPSRSGGVR